METYEPDGGTAQEELGVVTDGAFDIGRGAGVGGAVDRVGQEYATEHVVMEGASCVSSATSPCKRLG